ncbi:acyl carrier protein [Amycolatopsis xylanica]|uniref:Acyl carrier protein n=1 Tax=Amycolatopsis xylanica TaxID=589385 RepID=A0A1H3SDB4_9PSEU|nr:phosphopantetheine-binding protein [Amycolatopsis xylanica]SDZ35541.1 acyl carrier protein [Amycolatopsis xylanica]
MSEEQWSAAFREILIRHLPMAEAMVEPDAALAGLGLDSLGTVNLVLELEDSLGVSIPDELLVRETFLSAATLWTAVSGLLMEPGHT